jgi:hypothetical protein
MSYLSNAHRPYDSPDLSSYSHTHLRAQSVRIRNIVNMSTFDSLSAQHSAQPPDHGLPKVGETRCCQCISITYFTFLRGDRSFIHCFIYPPTFFASSSASINISADPPSLFSYYSDWTLLSSDLRFVYLDPVLSSHLVDQAEDLIGRSLLEFVHPDEQASAKTDLGNVLSTKALHGSVTRYASFLPLVVDHA